MEDFPWTFQLENFDTGRLFAARNYGQEYNLGTFGPICAETRHRAIRGEELKKNTRIQQSRKRDINFLFPY